MRRVFLVGQRHCAMGITGEKKKNTDPDVQLTRSVLLALALALASHKHRTSAPCCTLLRFVLSSSDAGSVPLLTGDQSCPKGYSVHSTVPRSDGRVSVPRPTGKQWESVLQTLKRFERLASKGSARGRAQRWAEDARAMCFSPSQVQVRWARSYSQPVAHGKPRGSGHPPEFFRRGGEGASGYWAWR